MKVLSRDFTLKEKILIFVLLLILVALTYYRFVHVPCNEAIETARSEKEMYDTELLAVQKKEAQIRAMKEELDSLGELQATSRMESYNNSKAELSLLNSVLESAYNYSISFASVTRSGDQIRRNFNLQFTTGSFDAAKQIISSLADSEYRCLVDDIRCALDTSNNSSRGIITVNATATFFETMVGGTADAGLPADADAAPASVE